jgi:glycerol-3-phosphate cytidylyltransferase-like family protein
MTSIPSDQVHGCRGAEIDDETRPPSQLISRNNRKPSIKAERRKLIVSVRYASQAPSGARDGYRNAKVLSERRLDIVGLDAAAHADHAAPCYRLRRLGRQLLEQLGHSRDRTLLE